MGDSAVPHGHVSPINEAESNEAYEYARAIESAVRASALPQEPVASAWKDEAGKLHILNTFHPAANSLPRGVELALYAAPSAPATPPAKQPEQPNTVHLAVQDGEAPAAPRSSGDEADA